MKRLLTIAIPTFNRASLLDDQLKWFAQAVSGKEDLCELIVSDNCSTDTTPAVIAKWRETLASTGLSILVRRNEYNQGAIRNIAACLEHASGRHVWTVSDDDAVAPSTLQFVLSTLEADPELSLLVLNFSNRKWKSGKLKYDRCFEVETDLSEPHGQGIFERILSDPNRSRWGGLALTTALIYRTETAQAALRHWPEGLDNFTLQLYVTAYCARHGKTLLTKDAHLEMLGGRHFFDNDRQLYFRFKIAEVPEAFVKLAELGYSRELCRQKVVNQREELKWKLVWQNISRSPLATFRVLNRYRTSLSQLSS